jgi:hypothetical protein
MKKLADKVNMSGYTITLLSLSRLDHRFMKSTKLQSSENKLPFVSYKLRLVRLS